MKTIKALVKKKAEPGLGLDDVPPPEVGINDVLIEVLRSGICGTDVPIYNWEACSQRSVPVPLVIGQEFVGRVVDVGLNVKDFHPGAYAEYLSLPMTNVWAHDPAIPPPISGGQN
jgi:threonine 3-dehydrogenase